MELRFGWLLVAGLVGLGAPARASAGQPASSPDTCAACHATLQDARLSTPARAFSQPNVHRDSGIRCADCHGGNSSATDKVGAHDAGHGFKGVSSGAGAAVNACGTCHAAFAQKFASSVHSQIFDRGCVECHGSHAVLAPSDGMLGTDARSLCTTCHNGADNKGAAAAARMRSDIERLTTGLDRSTAIVARLTNAGMDMSAQELALGTARSRVTLARTEMHAFDPARVTPIVDEGIRTVAGVDQAGERASGELRFRRRGLAAALVAILLVVVALGFKIRQIDRRT